MNKRWQNDMKFQILLLIFVNIFTSVICDVKSNPLPRQLKNCLIKRADDDPEATDEEVTTSCMLEFMWLNKKNCEIATPETVNWLSSLVNRSVEQTAREMRENNGVPPTDNQGSTTPRLILMNDKPEVERMHFSPTLLSSRTLNIGPPRRRKEYRMLSDDERRRYHNAINAMKNDQRVLPNKFDALVSYHQSATRSAHGGPAFLGWHRYYLVMYEMALQEQDPDVMLAYWDSTLENGMEDPTDSVLWTHEFAGNGEGNVVSGPFGNWTHNEIPLSRSIGRFGRLIDRRRINRLIRTRRSHAYFARMLEMQHNGVHVYVGGNMLEIALAPSDPIFYMHHAFIDCVWEQYRQRQIRIGNDPTTYPSVQRHLRQLHGASSLMMLPPLDGRNLTNRDGFASFWTRDYYRCATLPWCSNNKPSCGSKWLRCDLFRKRCVPRGSSAARPEITTERMLRMAENLAPEPMLSVSQNEQRPSLTSREIFPAFMSDEEEAEIEEKVTQFEKIVSSEAFFFLLNESITESSELPPLPPPVVPSESGTQSDLSIDNFVIPEREKVCGGVVTQNTFSIDCEQTSNLWTYIPVEVAQLRHGSIVYGSHPVDSNGKFNENTDVYSTGEEIPFLRNIPTKEGCKLDKSGLTKVKIVAYGLDYNGIYEDHVFLDNRQSVSQAVTYIAVKRPSYWSSSATIFFTAINECGTVCQPMIMRKQRKYGYPSYRRFNGVVVLSAKSPIFHSNTYRGAEALVWQDGIIPYQNNNQIPIKFYCNYFQEKPWSRT